LLELCPDVQAFNAFIFVSISVLSLSPWVIGKHTDDDNRNA
jgi:hypothetical protein